MKGSHRIIVESRKVKYDFVIHRNITIITGDSGSGKTVLIDLIHDYGRYGADSGVFLSCDCPCKVIDSEDWERKIEETTGSIIFIDEGNRFLVSKKFAQLVQGSDNYFVQMINLIIFLFRIMKFSRFAKSIYFTYTIWQCRKLFSCGQYKVIIRSLHKLCKLL